ncbi:reverse transcriptase domain-containing protein [Tanacetum coccineum]|uniref:Reverse transcriptase domain-containing protein n=1 Tax=Tanacetum coccineum TaxID=301880 RepID=A0ABQ5G1H0_9ASTR
MDAMTIKMDARYKEHQSRAKQPTPDLDDDDTPMSREEEAKFMQAFPKFDRLADKQSGRPFGSLPSNTQPNPRGNNFKAYQPLQSRNEHVNAVFTRSAKSYDPPDNPNDQQNNSETPINFDSDDEDDEPTPKPKTQPSKLVKETLLPKPYKPKIPYHQLLRKEKMEAQYKKFLDMIRAVRINIPFVDVLAGKPNYDKFIKELISNKHKIEQIFAAFLTDKSSAILQNKVPPKLGDPGSFLIPCNFNKTFSCNALADLAKNMLVEVGKFTFPVDFVILEMEEDSKVPLILGRPFLHTADAVIRVKQKQLNLGVVTERMFFNIDSTIKHSYSNDDTCFSIDVIDEILKEDFDTLLEEGSKILHSIVGTILEEEIFFEFDKFITMASNENYDSESDEEPKFEKISINTDYKIKTSLEEPPTDLELKPLPHNLEYVFLEEPYFLPVIISSQLSTQNKSKLVYVLKNIKKHLPGKQKTFLEKCHFMVKEGIVFGHKVSGARLEVDKAKINVISKLPPPTNIKGVRSFLGHAGFYGRFIKYFSKIARPLTKLLKKDTLFEFDDECQKAFELLKEKLTCAPVIVSPNWNLPFELMCDASDFTVGASKTLNPTQQKYTITEKELMAVKQDAKPRLIRWILLLQEFDIEIKDKRGTENVVVDHLSRIDNNKTSDDSEVDDNFPGENLMENNTRDEPWGERGEDTEIVSHYKFKAFETHHAYYWIDVELYSDWYKSALYEMYVSMNPEQRDLFEHEVNQQEREIESEQRIAALEKELRANSKMVDELKRAKSDVGRWRKISTFLLFDLCVMFFLLLVVL